jgi:hypothetical protein
VQFAGERSRMMAAVMWRESHCPLYGSSVPVKVVRIPDRRCAPGFLLAAPPLIVLAEPGDMRLGFRAGTCGQSLKTSLASICMTQEPAEINCKISVATGFGEG